jgi:hypothetical protein
MASTGAAPAPARVIVGPLVTQAGFQYWYLACLPDCIVAVRQGIGAFFALGLSHNIAHAFGLLGALVKHLLQPRAQSFRQQIEARLQSVSAAQLRTKPNIVFPVSQLRSITYKAKKGAPLFMSDFALEAMTGRKTTYGIAPADFEKIISQLKQMYPTLVK